MISLEKNTLMQIRIRTRRNLYFQMLVTVFRWCLMIISCFVCDFVVAQIRRYADTQIGVLAFSPLMHASSLK